jgi:hypothetical protein
MMAEDIKKFPRTDFYRGLGELTTGFLQSDLDLLNEVLADADGRCPESGALPQLADSGR